MNRTLTAALLAAIILIAAAPEIARGINHFKTFIEFSSLLNPCDGAGSPPPCY